jgi:hypothetical protein
MQRHPVAYGELKKWRLNMGYGKEMTMAYDVFISYSSKDKTVTDGICANLETEGIRLFHIDV